MKILLQDVRTSLFIEIDSAGWTAVRERARDFKHGIEALRFCFAAGHLNMQMIVENPDSRMSFSCPVTNFRGA